MEKLDFVSNNIHSKGKGSVTCLGYVTFGGTMYYKCDMIVST